MINEWELETVKRERDQYKRQLDELRQEIADAYIRNLKKPGNKEEVIRNLLWKTTAAYRPTGIF